jgi:hypothetical protein
MKFSEWFLSRIKTNGDEIYDYFWTDECKFSLDHHINTYNCYSYANEDSKYYRKVRHTMASVMVWCGISCKGVVGPYFFDTMVIGETFQKMLKDLCFPSLNTFGLTHRTSFKQDGTPSHTAHTTLSLLNEVFKGRVISQGCPIPWPPRSPDLNPLDFWFWGYLKHAVFSTPSSRIGELRFKIAQECFKITPEMCKKAFQAMEERCSKCIELGEKQVE